MFDTRNNDTCLLAFECLHTQPLWQWVRKLGVTLPKMEEVTLPYSQLWHLAMFSTSRLAMFSTSRLSLMFLSYRFFHQEKSRVSYVFENAVSFYWYILHLSSYHFHNHTLESCCVNFLLKLSQYKTRYVNVSFVEFVCRNVCTKLLLSSCVEIAVCFVCSFSYALIALLCNITRPQ